MGLKSMGSLTGLFWPWDNRRNAEGILLGKSKKFASLATTSASPAAESMKTQYGISSFQGYVLRTLANRVSANIILVVGANEVTRYIWSVIAGFTRFDSVCLIIRRSISSGRYQFNDTNFRLFLSQIPKSICVTVIGLGKCLASFPRN